MGKLTEMDARETFGKVNGLDFHLRANFYPPHPDWVIRDIKTAFQEHWDGELDDHLELAERCHLRSVDGLYRYFDSFLNECEEY